MSAWRGHNVLVRSACCYDMKERNAGKWLEGRVGQREECVRVMREKVRNWWNLWLRGTSHKALSHRFMEQIYVCVVPSPLVVVGTASQRSIELMWLLFIVRTFPHGRSFHCRFRCSALQNLLHWEVRSGPVWRHLSCPPLRLLSLPGYTCPLWALGGVTLKRFFLFHFFFFFFSLWNWGVFSYISHNKLKGGV